MCGVHRPDMARFRDSTSLMINGLAIWSTLVNTSQGEKKAKMIVLDVEKITRLYMNAVKNGEVLRFVCTIYFLATYLDKSRSQQSAQPSIPYRLIITN